VLNLAHDVEVPALLVARLILEALEWNADLDLVPVVCQPPLRAEHEILAQIRRDAAGESRRPRARETLPLLNDRTIHLYAKGIHTEHIRLTVVVERAEEDLHVVVGRDLVAISECRVDRAMRLERADAEVDRRGRIPHEHVGGIGRWNPIVGRELREPREHVRLLPHRLVENAVHGHIARETGNADVQLILTADICDREHRSDSHYEKESREHFGFRGGQTGGAIQNIASQPQLCYENVW
jgi:hypothetical protein